MVRIKICGITNLADALQACNAGANALGFVFYDKSPRYINPKQAQAIISKLPPFISKVGLFVNHTDAEVASIVASVDLDYLQFHGCETAVFCSQFKLPFMKAIRVGDSQDIVAAMTEFSTAKALLLDAKVKNKYGGTGKKFDWDLIPEKSKIPFIVAGGLTKESVADLLIKKKFFAVDVSSGVESSYGKKDIKLLRQFCQIVIKFNYDYVV